MRVASYFQVEDRLRLLDKLHSGTLDVCMPSTERRSLVGVRAGPHARVELKRWDAVEELARLETGCIEQHLQGAWDSPDLVQLLTLMQLNADTMRESGWRTLVSTMRSLVGVRFPVNIHARYRLGNAFFAEWLDPSMAYSAGCFDGGARGLHAAQLAKYEMVLRAVEPEPEHTLLDIGCGWGGFALYAAARAGCRVHAVCIAKRQVEWARKQVRAAGLEGRVYIECRDYRDLRDTYDRVVSIEAYEATGRRAWPAYFRTLSRSLKPGGVAFLQAAFVDDQLERCISASGFLRRNIHAKAALASRRTLHDQLHRARLCIVDACDAADDAARTLASWRERFQRARPAPENDERFRRLWNFYLAHCEAGYRSGRTGLLRATLRHAA